MITFYILGQKFIKFFVASWGLPGSFLGLPRDLVSNTIIKEVTRSPKKLPGSPKEAIKNFQRRNPYNIFVGFLVKTVTSKRHFEINWPLARRYDQKRTVRSQDHHLMNTYSSRTLL